MPSQCLSLGSFWFNMSNEARIMHGLKNPIAAALVYVRFAAFFYSINYILKIGTEFGKYRYLLHNNDSTWHTAHGTLNITAHGTLNIIEHH